MPHYHRQKCGQYNAELRLAKCSASTKVYILNAVMVRAKLSSACAAIGNELLAHLFQVASCLMSAP